jgi:predicted nucleic-acid-binding Zn-ribbon protein
MKYCKNCGQNVSPTKKFSFGWFIVNCLWLVGGIVYLFYFLFMKKKVCPMCGAHNFEHKHSAEKINSIRQVERINKIESCQTG